MASPSNRERNRIALALLGTVCAFAIALTALAATRSAPAATSASLVQIKN